MPANRRWDLIWGLNG